MKVRLLSLAAVCLSALSLQPSAFPQTTTVTIGASDHRLKQPDIKLPSGATFTIEAGATLDLSGGTITLPSSVVTLTGTQTLTNKTLTAPVLGAASGTSLLTSDFIRTTGANAYISTIGANAYISTTGTNAAITTSGASASIGCSGASASIYATGTNGVIFTAGSGGHIYTLNAAAHIQTRSTFKLNNGTHITTLSHAPTAARAIVLPDADGTLLYSGGPLGTPASGTLSGSFVTGGTFGAVNGSALTNITATTNANLTGHVTSTGNAAVLGSFTLAQLNNAVTDANVARTDDGQTFANEQVFSGTVALPLTTATAGIVTQIVAGAQTRLLHTWNGTSGARNLFLGQSAGNLSVVTSAVDNVGVGFVALTALTSGADNLAFGSSALQAVNSGGQNTGIGRAAASGVTTGTRNTAVGYLALSKNTSAGMTGSTGIGWLAGENLTGDNNTLIGYLTGNTLTTGTYNTCLGSNANITLATATYATAVGAGSTNASSNSIVLGRSAGTDAVLIPGALTVTGASTLTGGVTVGSGGTALLKVMSATAALDFGNILAATNADLTITVTGAAVGDAVALGLPAAPDASLVFNGFVSSANTVTVRAFNVGAIAVDPASATFRAQVNKF